MIKIDTEQRRRRLAVRHRLVADRRTDNVVAITEDLVALHSSDPATVYLSAWARMVRPSVEAVEVALYDDRSLVRHHAMRRTLWVMTPEVARLAHGAATAKIARAERKKNLAAFADCEDIGDAEAWLATATAEIVALLAKDGSQTTRAIGKALPHLTVPVLFGARTKHPAPIKAHTKVLQGAGFDATLVRGRPVHGWNSAEYRWIATDAWLGQPIAGLDEEPAAAELVDRWLRRFGPATETDIKWWFGWTAGLTRKALAACDAVAVELESAGTGSRDSGFVAAGDAVEVDDPGPWVRLLPGLDPTAMGWKQREWYLDPAATPHLFDRSGNAGPTVWADGRVVGAWGQRRSGEIVVDLIADLDAEHRPLLDQAVAEMAAAIGDVVVRPRFPAPAQKAIYTS